MSAKPMDDGNALRTACERLRQVRGAFLAPSARSLDDAAPALAAAVVELHSFTQRKPARRPDLLASALELQREVARLQLLLDSCAGFHDRWAGVLKGLSGGYTAGGAPRPLSAAGRVSLEG